MKSRRDGLRRHMPRSGVHRIALPEPLASALPGPARVAIPREEPLSILFADAGSNLGDAMVEPLARRHVVTRASSVQDAAELLRTAHFEVAMVSLDLQPAPHAGVRLAEAALVRGVPVVLVTRSLRWVPPSATQLKVLAWVSPESDDETVEAAIREAVDSAPGPSSRASGRESIGF